jgi:spore coat protein U-like protein
MCRHERFVVLALGALAALLGTSATAMAQQASASVSARAGATIVAATGIVTNTAELSFGSVVASASEAGTVEQTAAASPARTGIGVALGSAATISAATFRVTGDGSATYAIMLTDGPETVTHNNATDRMTVIPFSSLPNGTGLLNAGGAKTIYVGGTLNVAKNQRPGTYAGRFDVTVAYN